jgi:hypothetical protein
MTDNIYESIILHSTSLPLLQRLRPEALIKYMKIISNILKS